MSPFMPSLARLHGCMCTGVRLSACAAPLLVACTVAHDALDDTHAACMRGASVICRTPVKFPRQARQKWWAWGALLCSSAAQSTALVSRDGCCWRRPASGPAGARARALVARLHRAAERVGPARRPSGCRACGRGRECAGRRQVRRRPAPAPFPGAAPLSHRHHTVTPLRQCAVAVIWLYVPPLLRGAAPEGARRPPCRGGGPPHCGPQLG